MKNKNGFTLVELLGVVVILGIVFGLAVVTYRSTRSDINRSYYNTLEEGLLIPGGDYFNYNKGEGPGIFGDTAKVKIKDLEDEGYLDTEVVDSDGNPCDLENSYVGAYKDSIDKTNYYVCLVCGDYKTDNIACDDDRQRVDYSLGVRANKKDSKDVYDINGNSWSNEDIVLTFETLNEMDTVILENESGSETGRCNLTSKNNNIKSCTITITKSGNYQAYAKNNSNNATTRKQDIKILIDKENPTFDVLDQGVLQDGKKTIEVEIEAGITAVEKEITNQVNNIKDTGGSGIKSVEYSLEFDEDKDYYKEQGKVTTFNIKKTLKLGLHHLKIRVTDNAGNKTEENIEYVVYKLIVFPTKSVYCNNLTYNSNEQVLVKNPGEGYDFKRSGYSNTNIKEIYANNYNITIVLKDNYRFSKNDVEDKTLTCEIKKKSLTITANAQTIEYDSDISKTLNDVTPSGIATGDTLTDIKLDKDAKGNGNNKVSVSDAKITRNANNRDVTNCYKITYVNGNLIVNPKVSFSIDGTTEQSGYQNGAQVTVTCESIDTISSFNVTDDDGNVTTLTGGLLQSKTITLNTKGKERIISGVCTTNTGGSNSNEEKYNIYVNDNDSDSCPCAEANSCTNKCCGTKDCNCKDECVKYTCKTSSISGSHGGILYDCDEGTGKCTPNCEGLGGYWACTKSKSKCSTCNKSCSTEGCCGCKTRSSCWHL